MIFGNFAKFQCGKLIIYVNPNKLTEETRALQPSGTKKDTYVLRLGGAENYPPQAIHGRLEVTGNEKDILWEINNPGFEVPYEMILVGENKETRIYADDLEFLVKNPNGSFTAYTVHGISEGTRLRDPQKARRVELERRADESRYVPFAPTSDFLNEDDEDFKLIDDDDVIPGATTVPNTSPAPTTR